MAESKVEIEELGKAVKWKGLTAIISISNFEILCHLPSLANTQGGATEVPILTYLSDEIKDDSEGFKEFAVALHDTIMANKPIEVKHRSDWGKKRVKKVLTGVGTIEEAYSNAPRLDFRVAHEDGPYQASFKGVTVKTIEGPQKCLDDLKSKFGGWPADMHPDDKAFIDKVMEGKA